MFQLYFILCLTDKADEEKSIYLSNTFHKQDAVVDFKSLNWHMTYDV